MSEVQQFPDLNKAPSAQGAIGLASPQDRLAAFILDCTLLLPITQLIQAPLKRWMLESLLFYKGESAPFYQLASSLVFAILFIVYMGLMTYWKGQTLGKMFFKIKVISYQGSLSLTSSLMRSFSTLTEIIFFGIPFLALFSHALRRPIHDRVGDTLVISLENPIGFPQNGEKWKTRMLAMSAFVLIFSFVFLFWNLESDDKLTQDHSIFSRKVCNAQVEKVEGSLSGLIELYLIGQLNEECLFEEGREAIWQNTDSSLGNLAVALSTTSNEEHSDKYLKATCNEGGEENICELSQWLFAYRDGPEVSSAQIMALALKNDQQNFVKVFAALLLLKKGAYRDVENIMRSMESSGALSAMTAHLSFHSLLGQMKLEQAYWLSQTSDQLGEEQIIGRIRFEKNEGQLKTAQLIKILKFFYPDLDKQEGQRSLASMSETSEIQVLYKELLEAL